MITIKLMNTKVTKLLFILLIVLLFMLVLQALIVINQKGMLEKQDDLILQWRAEACNWREGAVYFSNIFFALMKLAGGENDVDLPDEIINSLAKGGWRYALPAEN